MSPTVLLDTGPLVALLNRRDHFHPWSVEQLANVRPPLVTCEAVIAEAFHLLRTLPRARSAILEMISAGTLAIAFKLGDEHRAVHKLIERFASVPMSLADACLVRMTELIPDCVVLTLDGDFAIYRRHKRQGIPHLIPNI